MKKIITLLLALVTTTAFAWPTQDITLIVPYPPGGVNDQIARFLQPDLESILKVRVQVLNLPGAANSVAINHVMSKANDDHTFIISMDDFVVGPLYQNSNSYSNFKATNIVGVVPYVLVGGKNSNTSKLQQQLKQKATINVGNNGINGGGYLWITGLKSPATVNSIYYKGSTPLLTDVIAGHTEYGVSSITAAYKFIQSDKLVPVMQSGKQRSSTYPNVPTQYELGFKGPSASTWFGVFTRTDTSTVATQRFSEVTKLIISNNSHFQEFKTSGMDVLNLGTNSSNAFFKEQIQHFEQTKR